VSKRLGLLVLLVTLESCSSGGSASGPSAYPAPATMNIGQLAFRADPGGGGVARNFTIADPVGVITIQLYWTEKDANCRMVLLTSSEDLKTCDRSDIAHRCPGALAWAMGNETPEKTMTYQHSVAGHAYYLWVFNQGTVSTDGGASISFTPAK